MIGRPPFHGRVLFEQHLLSHSLVSSLNRQHATQHSDAGTCGLLQATYASMCVQTVDISEVVFDIGGLEDASA